MLVTSYDEPATTAQLAAAVRAKPRTVLEHLKRLADAGLVQRLGHRWARIKRDSEYLDDLAKRFGTHGAADFYRQRHQAERDAYSEDYQHLSNMPRERGDARRGARQNSPNTYQPDYDLAK